jgi:hypothetical protein
MPAPSRKYRWSKDNPQPAYLRIAIRSRSGGVSTVSMPPQDYADILSLAGTAGQVHRLLQDASRNLRTENAADPDVPWSWQVIERALADAFTQYGGVRDGTV